MEVMGCDNRVTAELLARRITGQLGKYAQAQVYLTLSYDYHGLPVLGTMASNWAH